MLWVLPVLWVLWVLRGLWVIVCVVGVGVVGMESVVRVVCVA